MYSRSIRLLLVEDNPSDVWLVREALRLAQLAVQLTVSRDGVEALHYLHAIEAQGGDCPDLILLDLNLPRKNGREVLKEIQGTASLETVPIVVLSGSDADNERREAYRLNAASFITKPNNLPAYVEMVKGLEAFWGNNLDLRRTA